MSATAEKKEIKVPQQLFREAIFTEEGEGDQKQKQISISSDVPYLRYDWWNDEEYYEVLDHSPGGFNDARLKAGLPMLFNHNRADHLGRARSFSSNGKRITVSDVIWGESALAKEKKADHDAGVLVDTSVGYSIIGDGECVGAKDGIPIYKFKWEPHEFSLVTIPADITVGSGRNRSKPDCEPNLIAINLQKGIDEPQKKEHKQTIPMADPVTPTAEQKPTVDLVKERGDAITEFKAKCKRIDDFVAGLKNESWKKAAATVALKHKDGEANFDEFRAEALNSFEGATRIDTPQTEIGMSDKDLRRYSLARAIYLRGTGKPLDGLEKEASDATAKLLRKEPDGFFIPEDWSNRSLREIHGLGETEMSRQTEMLRQFLFQTRTLTAGNFPSAGALVGVDLLAGSLIELLRNKQVFGSLGTTNLGGLTGNVAIPRQTGASTAYWLPEGGSVTASDQTFNQLGLTPHRLAAQTAYDKQLLAQASISVEAMVRNDIALQMALKKDLAILVGTGTAGEPLGIYNTTGVQTVTFSGAATWAKILEFETNLATANADQTGMPVWITSPAVRGKWKNAPKIAASTFPIFLWGDDNQVNGYGTAVSNQVSANASGSVPANAVYYGVPSEIIDATWAGIDTVVNPYSLDSTGQIRLTIQMFVDLALRHAPAWVVSTDSGAQ
jgi:HK97 family phage major capsid protein